MNEIFIDWGSTNLRAFLMKEGSVSDRRTIAGRGVLQLQSQSQSQLSKSPDRAAFFSKILGDLINGWPDSGPVYMCGAIGSREGWVDTGYVEAPAGIPQLAQALRFLKTGEHGTLQASRVGIVPGLAIASAGGRYDVMRSEEVKSLGALLHLGVSDGVLCIPGTHCKWVRINEGSIIDFVSVMTGEIYNLVQTAGALAPLVAGEKDALDIAEFERGLQLEGQGDDLLADLWQVRSMKIRAQPAHLKSLLSGILIGHELRQAARFARPDEDVVLLSDPGTRLESYRYALSRAGWRVETVIDSETAVCTGLRALTHSSRLT
jgi:2-dehydro-3-deoxygalactonokinase